MSSDELNNLETDVVEKTNAAKAARKNDVLDALGDTKEAEETPYVNSYIAPREILDAKQKKTERRGKAWIRLAKRKGPLTGIIFTLVGGGIIFGGLLSPSLLIVHLKETLADRLHSAAPALNIRTKRMISSKMRTVQDSFAQATPDGRCGIRCRFGSMTETMKLNFEAKGFKIDVQEGKFGRLTVKKMTFPDGFEVFDGAGFKTAVDNPIRASSFKGVFNSKVAYFLNSKFGSIIKVKFGLDKLSGLIGTVKTDIIASIRKKLGFEPLVPGAIRPDPLAALRGNPKYAKTIDFVDGQATKVADKLTNIIGSVCSIYNTGKGVTYAIKAAKIAAFVTFAMVFLNAADQIKGGDSLPEQITEIGDRLTLVDEGGMTATDSLGYRMAAFGDKGSLSEEDQKYSATPSGFIGSSIGKLLAELATIGLAASSVTGLFCRFSGNNVISTALSCVPELVAMLAGIATGGILSGMALFECVGKSVSIGLIASFAIGAVINAVIGAIANSEVPILDETTIGSAAGNALYSGTSQILGGTAASYGLKAGSTAEITQYAIDTTAERQQQDAIARYEAKDTPFDIYNQYSFLGSMIKNTNMYAVSNSSSFMSFFGNILSIIPRSFASITNNVNAQAFNTASLYEAGQCNDAGLLDIGVNGDAFCNPSYVMSGEEMEADSDAVAQYMLGDNVNGYVYVDELTGDVKYDGTKIADILGASMYYEKNDYKNYLDNCADRTVPLGESSTGIESPYYEWETGKNCTRTNSPDLSKYTDDGWNQMLSNFRVYTMDKSISRTMDGESDSIVPADVPDESLTSPEATEPEVTEPGSNETGPTEPAEPASAESQRLAKSILNSGRVNDTTGQLRQIADGNPTYVNQKILEVLSGLSTSFTFNITDLYNPNRLNLDSKHIIGNAVDVNNIIMGGSTGSLNSGSYDNIVQTFINQAAFLFGDGCGLGVPNNQYINSSRGSCAVFIDNKEPHIHLDVR